MMHAANLSSSPRLRRVLEVLGDGRDHSTLDLISAAQVCAVNSIIAELRANGVAIDCRRDITADGTRIWFYRLGGHA